MGDMSRVGTGRVYGLVYLVFNTIGNLLTQDDQVRCFENAARHLTDDGDRGGVEELADVDAGERRAHDHAPVLVDDDARGPGDVEPVERDVVFVEQRQPEERRRLDGDGRAGRAYGAGVFSYHQSCRWDISARRSIRSSSTVGRPTYHQPL